MSTLETSPPLRLGFAVKVLGRADLKSNDARRWQSGPHLRVSLEYVRAIFDYLAEQRITMYRMSSDLAPYATHPDLPQFWGQIRECNTELRELGAVAKQRGLRLSFHPSQFVVLNSPNPEIVAKSIRDLDAQAEMLDCMELGPEAVLVIHVGGTYGDRASGWRRWAETYGRLGEPVRRRLVLENDDIRYPASDVLAIHELTGVPLIFDYQHHWCNNPERLDVAPTLRRFIASWPAGVLPKIHFSSPRTEMREIRRRNRSTGKQETVLQPPIWTGHADFVNPFEFATFMREAGDLSFDVMLEAKSKDLALLRLRRDLPRYAPELALRFGFEPPAADAEGADEPDQAVEAAMGASA